LLQASALQTRLVEAQLKALKMQLHPHFLFNTLHTITALIHEDAEMAERTIARLGELLRLFLATSAVHEAPLREELRILGLYLEIERARFEERLQVRYDVPENLQDAVVPNLVLQPLVENSIRHGIGRRAEPGWILVAAERDADKLVLRVTDNGEGLKQSPLRTAHEGMGLTITRGRLATLYGPNQSLVLRNVPLGGVEARITLPFRENTGNYDEKDHVELQSTHR
jgi:LytS/YehU family sensor histidine kinase